MVKWESEKGTRNYILICHGREFNRCQEDISRNSIITTVFRNSNTKGKSRRVDVHSWEVGAGNRDEWKKGCLFIMTALFKWKYTHELKLIKNT